MRHAKLPVIANARGTPWIPAWAGAVLLVLVAPAHAAGDRADPPHAARDAAASVPRALDPAPLSTAATAAPKGGGIAVPRSVIAGGGGTSTGGTFAISGTIGQADADPLQPSTGGVFAITGGFWPALLPATPPSDPVFADGFEPLPP